jgi:hypothetical protein
MKRIGILIMSVLAYAITFADMFNTAALAAQKDTAPAVQRQAGLLQAPVDKPLTDSRPAKTVLSNHNKMMIEQAEQRKLRQVEIDAERSADPQSK